MELLRKNFERIPYAGQPWAAWAEGSDDLSQMCGCRCKDVRIRKNFTAGGPVSRRYRPESD